MRKKPEPNTSLQLMSCLQSEAAHRFNLEHDSALVGCLKCMSVTRVHAHLPCAKAVPSVLHICCLHGLQRDFQCWAQVYAVLFDIDTGESSELLEDHVLLLVVNHICSDGLSEKICVDEMAAAYNAFASTGHPPASGTLPDLPVSWVDYCFWQQGRTASGSALEPQARHSVP